MYYNTWDSPPEPGGSYATHPAHAIFHPILTATYAVDTILQAYTLYLMLRVGTKQLKEYRYFMVLCTTWDMCISVGLGFLLQPKFHSPLSACWSARGPLSVFGNEGSRFGLVSLFGFGTALIASQYYCVLYRIVAILRSPDAKRKFLSLTCTVFLLSAITTAAVLVGYAVSLATTWETEVFDSFVQNITDREYLTDADSSIACFNVYHNASLYALGAIAVAFIVSQAVFTSGGIWVIFRVRKSVHQTERTRRMHLQFTRLLLLQMFCPVLCMLGPILVPFSMMITAHYTPLVVFYFCLTSISVFPMINAILTLIFVSPYRKHTLQWIQALRKGHFNNKTEAQFSTTSQQANPAAEHRTVTVSIPVRR